MSDQNSPGNHLYRFDDITVDCENFRVQKAGQNVSLTPRAFDVLVLFLRNGGQVVDKQRLFEQVWKDTFVSDNALTKIIKEIRHALEDSADKPRYIETVPKRGYRFIGELEPEPPQPVFEVKKTPAGQIITEDEPGKRGILSPRQLSSPRFTLSKTTLALSVIGVISISALLGWLWLRPQPAPSSPIRAIAVLPFVNESGNAEVEYLSDGMTESLINSLSRLPYLSIKARSTVFHYKGQEVQPQRIATELSVQAILSGRVVQRGNDLTLYLSLVDGRNGDQLWGEQYDRKLTDLLNLQGEIAQDVSEKLRLRLTSSEQQRLTRQGTENTEAYRGYLKGRFYWNKGMAPGYEKSREYFQQAINLDPTYALAYSGLADYYGFASAVALLPPNETWPKAEAAVNKALTLDDTLAEAYNPLAACKLYYYRDRPAAERAFRRGIELNPKFAEIRAHYALFLMLSERNEEALSEAQHSIELDPLSARFNYVLGRILFFTRHYDGAIDQFQKTLEIDPNYVPAREELGDAYEKKGLRKEAVAEWAKALTLRGEAEQASSLERVFAGSGFELAVRALAQKQLAKLNERMKQGEYVSAADYVMTYTRVDDKEHAFAWLAKAVQERTGFVFIVGVSPFFDRLRDDPRYTELIHKIGLQH